MRLQNNLRLSIASVLGCVALIASVALSLAAQDNPSQPKGAPDDWTHHHVIFSNPGTMQDAIKDGSYERWLRVQTDPRFKMQQMKRQAATESQQTEGIVMPPPLKKTRLNRDWNVSLGAGGVAATMYPAKYSFDINNASCSDFVVFPANSAGLAPVAASRTGTFTGNPLTDQTVTIGGSETLKASESTPEFATIVLNSTDANRPADGSSVTIGSITYTFRDVAALSMPGANACNIRSRSLVDTSVTVAGNLVGAITNDMFGNRGSSSTWLCSSGSTPNSAVDVGYSGELTIHLNAMVWGSAGFTFSQSGTTNFTSFSHVAGTDGTNTGTSFAIDNVLADNAANLASAITRNGGTVGVTATSIGAVVTVTANTPGTSGNSITLAGTLSFFTWAGGTLTGGADGQANLVGIKNLYSGPSGLCGSAPTVLFSYQVGTGTVRTSPVLSLDGTKVAYMESISGGSKFHVLTIGTSGSNGSSAILPVTPGTGNNALDVAITMNGTVQVTRSSPYVDYSDDFAYVGDDAGRLHKFTGVFKGTPTEVVGGGWPVTVSSGNILTGPTLDYGTGNIFVGDSLGVLRFVNASTGVVGSNTVNVGNLNGTGTNSGRPIIDPPVVDSSIGKVYAFIGCALGSSGTCGSGSTLAYAFQGTTSLATGGTNRIWTPVGLSSGTGTNNIHMGAFDNGYYTNPANGHLYVCGEPRSTSNPFMYQVGFASGGSMNTTSTQGPSLSSSGTASECSPMTEFYNTPTSKDWLFVSVGNHCNALGGGSAGCVMNFDISSGMPSGSTAAFGQSTGTSAIIIDNYSSAGQASSIYYGALPSGTNACVKLTQANLN